LSVLRVVFSCHFQVENFEFVCQQDKRILTRRLFSVEFVCLIDTTHLTQHSSRDFFPLNKLIIYEQKSFLRAVGLVNASYTTRIKVLSGNGYNPFTNGSIALYEIPNCILAQNNGIVGFTP
jgi:hypothetical protein